VPTLPGGHHQVGAHHIPPRACGGWDTKRAGGGDPRTPPPSSLQALFQCRAKKCLGRALARALERNQVCELFHNLCVALLPTIFPRGLWGARTERERDLVCFSLALEHVLVRCTDQGLHTHTLLQFALLALPSPPFQRSLLQAPCCS